MFEATGDLWEYEPADVRCVTTNGTVKRNGEAVMGRGCAKEAAERFPWVQLALGALLRDRGNHVHQLGYDDWGVLIYSFPVKHNWWEKADLALIARSAHELMEEIKACGFENVLLPRPGCGNGGLRWEDVRPVLEPILDGRVTIISHT